MLKSRKLKIIYIGGNGHSGSTLLDMIIGNNEGYYSGGELINITRNGILEEYCSCKKEIKNCNIWVEITKNWDENRTISKEEFHLLRLKFDRNKSLFITLFNVFFPGKAFRKYCLALQQLFEAIQDVTKADYIIDSSKSPLRALILMKISNVYFIHLCRNFKGVLNSAKKYYPQDLEGGIEEEILPRKSFKVMIDWILNNALCEINKLFVKSVKVMFHKIPFLKRSFKKLGLEIQYSVNDSISAPHMFAGNAIRLKNKVIFTPKIGEAYSNLTSRQKRVSSTIDSIFWFWN